MELELPADFEPRAIAGEGGRLLVLGGPKGSSPLDKPPRRLLSFALDGSAPRLVVEDSFGEMLAAHGGYAAWASPYAVSVRAIEGDDPIAPADAKMSCPPAVSGGVCLFVARPTGDGSPVARLDARSGQIRVLCTMVSEVGALAIAGGCAFVTEPAARAVHRVSLEGGVPDVVVRGEEHVGPLAADGETVFAVVDRAVLAMTTAGGPPRAVASAHDAFRQAKKIAVGPDALYVVTRPHVVSTGGREQVFPAAVHRVAREGHGVETVLSLEPPPGADFLARLRADVVEDVAVVGDDVFALTRARGKVRIARVDRPAPVAPPEPVVVDPVREAYEAHLGPRQALEPGHWRLAELGWPGAIVQGRTASRLWYTATAGLRRGKGAYEITLLHARREAWATGLVAALVAIELGKPAAGDVLELLARHGGVTAGPFPITKKKEVGLLLVDGPPLLPWKVDDEGGPVRLLRAVVLTRDELGFAAERGVAALLGRLGDVLASSVSDLRRASAVL